MANLCDATLAQASVGTKPTFILVILGSLTVTTQPPLEIRQITVDLSAAAAQTGRTDQEAHWTETDTLNLVVSEGQAPTIDQLFSYRDAEQVSNFLREHSFLEPLLWEARTYVTKIFPCAPLWLRVLTNPEDIDDEQLVLFIGVTDDARTAFVKLQQLDTDWWIGAMDRARGKFHVNLEFQ